jgi:hypothetical protein
MRALISCVLFISLISCANAVTLSHANMSNSAPGMLEGADRLLSCTASGVGLSPALNVNDVKRRNWLWLGLSSNFVIRNSSMAVENYNNHAGHYLDSIEKRAILNELGSSIIVDQESNLNAFALSIPLGMIPQGLFSISQSTASRFKFEFETEMLEILFFGNDPLKTIELESADLNGQISTRVDFSISGRLSSLPEAVTAVLPGSSMRWGLSAVYHKGHLYAETESFSASLAPPVESISGSFEHVLRRSEEGSGISFDLGIGLDSWLLDRPISVDLVVRELFASYKWENGEREFRSFYIPNTPISTEFDQELFEEQLLDTTIVEELGEFKVKPKPGFSLGARWAISKKWRQALLIEWQPETVANAKDQRISLYHRWVPGRGRFYLGFDLGAGFGRGPSFGTDLGWTWRLRYKKTKIVDFQFGLAAKSYAGIFNSSRGVFLGSNIGFIF